MLRVGQGSEVSMPAVVSIVMCAGTAFNRWAFFCRAKEVLSLCAPAGLLTMLDVHSVLQELCPNWPLTLTKNAFTPAISAQGMRRAIVMLLCARPA